MPVGVTRRHGSRIDVDNYSTTRKNLLPASSALEHDHRSLQAKLFATTKAMLYRSLSIAVCLLLVSCSDNRVGLSQAKLQFEQLYPDIQIISVRISEDEVVARSFEFRYRTLNDKRDKTIAIQFMNNEKTGRWEPNPQPPNVLP